MTDGPDMTFPEDSGRRERLAGISTQTPRRGGGLSYTRFVRWMRFLLPMAALAILAVLVAWPDMKDVAVSVEAVDVTSTPGQTELVSPRFESQDDDEQPFTITASRAIQSQFRDDLVILEAPLADMTLKDGAWVAAEAKEGAYMQEKRKLVLQGNVKLFHDRGYEMRTEKLHVDLARKVAWSDVPVNGHGPAGTIEAAGMRAQTEDGVLIFTGPAKVVLIRALEGL